MSYSFFIFNEYAAVFLVAVKDPIFFLAIDAAVDTRAAFGAVFVWSRLTGWFDLMAD